MNKHAVGANERGTVILLPPRAPMSADDALNLVAWIAVLAGLSGEEIRRAMLAVQCEEEIPPLDVLRDLDV